MDINTLLQELYDVWPLIAVIVGLVYQGWSVKQQLDRLESDHAEIKRTLEGQCDALAKFQGTVGEQVNTIMRDHSHHEIGQARIESKLEELIRR